VPDYQQTYLTSSMETPQSVNLHGSRNYPLVPTDSVNQPAPEMSADTSQAAYLDPMAFFTRGNRNLCLAPGIRRM
jgi:hypothetical protein